jgi:alpha-tubulin suppressor-like RCC1 family protein
LITFFRNSRVLQIAANGAQSAAITEDGSLFVWGWRDTPQVISTPEHVEELHNVLRVSLGIFHIVALCASFGDREVYTWGLFHFQFIFHFIFN